MIIRSDPRSHSQNKFGSVYSTRYYDHYGADETHLKLMPDLISMREEELDNMPDSAI